jgi:hypothetical protein
VNDLLETSKDVISQINTKKSLKIPRGNRKQENEEGQTIQWPKEKGQKTIHKTFHGQLTIEHHEPHLYLFTYTGYHHDCLIR